MGNPRKRKKARILQSLQVPVETVKEEPVVEEVKEETVEEVVEEVKATKKKKTV